MQKLKNKVKVWLPRNNDKVSIFIVGAQKSGTTALHHYLIQHPKIIGGCEKEINFFNHPEKFDKGESWYHQRFKRPAFYEKAYFIDSTPQYLFTSGVAKRIYQYNPDAQIIILLRNPISRAYSAWNMYRNFSNLDSQEKAKLINIHISDANKQVFRAFIDQQPFISFEEMVTKEIDDLKIGREPYPGILKMGIYESQIKEYFDVFDKDNILTIENGFFNKNRLAILNKILKKLDLTSRWDNEKSLEDIHVRKYNNPMDLIIESQLKVFYEDYNQKLYDLIGEKFDW